MVQTGKRMARYKKIATRNSRGVISALAAFKLWKG